MEEAETGLRFNSRIGIEIARRPFPANPFVFPRSRGIPLSPLSLAQAEPHGPGNPITTNQHSPRRRTHEIYGGMEDCPRQIQDCA